MESLAAIQELWPTAENAEIHGNLASRTQGNQYPDTGSPLSVLGTLSDLPHWLSPT